MTDLRIQPTLDRILRAELSPPDREALAGLVAAVAHALAADEALPTPVHLAAENALCVLGGGR